MTPATVREHLRATAWQSNLVGALITYGYFRFVEVEPTGPGRPLTAGEIAYFVVGFTGLIAAGAWLVARWNRPLETVPPADGVAGEPTRRRALQLPYAVAGITWLGWLLAGLIWGVGWGLISGTFSPTGSARAMFGITVISGTVATIMAFLIVERRWRRVLPAYFPGGGVTAVRGAPRLGVQARLLVVLLVVAVIPISVLGVASLQTARAVLAAGPGAGDVVTHMLVVVVFLGLASMLASVGLALSVSRSVAEPLGRLRTAMGEVERGRLHTRCPVVSCDEIGELTEGFNGMVRGLQERQVLREAFGRYVSEEIRDEILAGRVTLEGQLREATILFADIRDFTPWVEASDPREVVRDLNAYFTEMEAAIRAHGGLVVQYIGDEIEAVFGAPVARAGHARQAVRAAIEMRARLAAWNAARQRAGRLPLDNGIGIHTGTVLAGNIGSADRLSYALVGDPVNLASRLQGLTRELGASVLVSGSTQARLDGAVPLVPLPAVRVKGRMAEVEVYALG